MNGALRPKLHTKASANIFVVDEDKVTKDEKFQKSSVRIRWRQECHGNTKKRGGKTFGANYAERTFSQRTFGHNR